MMTLGQLRRMVAAQPAANDDREVKVWLPGSYISLVPDKILQYKSGLLIEGNLDPGSALRRDGTEVCDV